MRDAASALATNHFHNQVLDGAVARIAQRLDRLSARGRVQHTAVFAQTSRLDPGHGFGCGCALRIGMERPAAACWSAAPVCKYYVFDGSTADVAGYSDSAVTRIARPSTEWLLRQATAGCLLQQRRDSAIHIVTFEHVDSCPSLDLAVGELRATLTNLITARQKHRCRPRQQDCAVASRGSPRVRHCVVNQQHVPSGLDAGGVELPDQIGVHARGSRDGTPGQCRKPRIG